MSNLQTSYTKILSLLHEIEPEDYFLNQIRLPRMTDKELIALNLAAESLGIDSERYLFKRIPTALANKIERSVYNRRKRRLAHKMGQLQQKIAALIIPSESYHLIDSMPLEVCKLSRSRRTKICQEVPDSTPDYGYCAAQKAHYFGYKMHAVCTLQGVVKAFDLTPASTHDIHYLNDVQHQFEHCILVGDKGYLSHHYQHDLFETRHIELQTPKRRNQKDFTAFSPLLRKARKRIETLFSQLCDQFMVRRNYAKSFHGYASRILSKIAALTLIQWLNKKEGRNINNLKGVIS
jgi:hypothetical protein